MLTPELLVSYNSTTFIVDAVHSFRVGQPLPEDLVQWLRENIATTGVILGAEYPYSQPTTDEENELRHQHLIAECNARSLAWLPAVGRSDNWQERHLFVAGITNAEALDFCRRYEQNSIVFCVAGGLARLVMGGSGPQHTAT